jgi:hypothetical protein
MLRNRRLERSEDVVEVDHRPAVPGMVEGAAESWRIVDILGFTEEVALIELLSDRRNDGGETALSRTVVINQFGRDGLVHRSETYSPDQLDDALTRFDELSNR